MTYRLAALVLALSSMLVGVLILLLINTAQETKWAFLVGFLGTTLAIQLDLMSRVRDQGLEELEDSANLLLGRRTDSVLGHAYRSLVTSASADGMHREVPVFRSLAEQELHDCANALRALVTGQATLSPGDISLMAKFLEATQRTVKATTFADADLTWWNSTAGRNYLDLNREMIQNRAVHVEGIFLVRHHTPAIATLAQQQLQAGVEVYRVDMESVPVELHRNFVLYDDHYLVEDMNNADGEVLNCLHTTEPAKVLGSLHAYGTLKRFATPWPTDINSPEGKAT